MRYGQRWWRVPRVWLFAILVLLAPVLWYVHAYRLFLQYHNTFGIIASGYMKFGSVNLFTDPMFYAKTAIRVVLFHMTPLGFFLMAIGIVRPPGRPPAYLFHVWLGAVLVYFLVAAQGVYLGHYQYALPIVPPDGGAGWMGPRSSSFESSNSNGRLTSRRPAAPSRSRWLRSSPPMPLPRTTCSKREGWTSETCHARK